MPRKIKIVHVITSLGYGGAERLLLDLARHIDHHKFELSVITVVGGGPLKEEFERAGVKVIVNHKLTKPGLGVFVKIWWQLKKIQPDIVHTHLFAGDFWGGLAAKRASVPLIVSTAHNLDMDEGPRKKKIKQRLAQFTDKIIAVSMAVKKYCVKTEGVPEEKVTVIYNGVEIDKFFDHSPKLFSHHVVKIGVIGRLAEQKGQAILLEALPLMRQKDVMVKIAGEGPLEKSLKEEVTNLNLEKQVEFVGIQKDVAGFLKTVDIVAMPSRWEGLGLVLIEASLAGRIIVASNTGGIPEVVKNNETGLLVPPGNPQKLAEALDWVIEHKIDAMAMGLRAQSYCKKFDIKNMADQYENLYQKLIKQVLGKV